MKNDKVAIETSNKEKITYLELEDRIKNMYIWIKNNIATNNIAICLSNNEDILITFLACMRLGKNATLLYYNSKENTIKIVDESFGEITYITDIKNKDLMNYTNNKIVNIEDIHFGVNIQEKNIEDKSNQASIFFLTSGTTSNKSKIIEIKYTLFRKKIDMFKKHFNMINESDRLLILSPICFIQNLWAMFIHLDNNATIIFDKLVSTYGEKEFEENSITSFVTSPAVMKGLVKNFKNYNLRLLLMGGDFISKELIKELSHVFTKTLFSNIYGTTESSAGDTILEPQLIDTNKEEIFSIGKETELSHIIIVNENGEECKNNEIGEIAISGECVIESYYSDKNKMILKNGFFHTGDLAYKNEEGYIFFTGRKNYKIICNGINISPFEIEDIIMKSNLVKDCIVIGRKNEKYGEIPVACIISKDDIKGDIIEMLYKFLENKLEKYKIPKEFEIYKQFEKTDSGKIKRNLYK